jgi:hypothetical protein
MSELGFNRDDPEFASLIISGLCPTKLERSHLMSQLLLSCALAERIAPLSRAATLFKDGSGFRVNVGRVEVFTFISGSVRICCLAQSPSFQQESWYQLSTQVSRSRNQRLVAV